MVEFSGLFWPLFDTNCEDNMNSYEPHNLESKSGSKEPENRYKKFADRFFIERSSGRFVVHVLIILAITIGAVVIAPNLVDPSWIQPSSHFQVQMYEIADPNFYIARPSPGKQDLEFVYHLKNDYTLLAFLEDENMRIVAPPELEPYITRLGEKTIKLSPRLLMLREPQENEFKAQTAAEKLRSSLRTKWTEENKEKLHPAPDFNIYELYAPPSAEAFAVGKTEGVLENYISEHYEIVGNKNQQAYFSDPGVIYISNPEEYRIRFYTFAGLKAYQYDPHGQPVRSLEELTGPELGFMSRKELIRLGEQTFAAEGCWYCHTIQSRTLIQDSVLNGSDSFAAPPSSGNEYVYDHISFPGTRRIGPDLARVGVKRPSRDWHKAHFWEPRTESPGSIMPSFRHFFDDDPRGVGNPTLIGVPNRKFEAIFQYLMLKGTRITPPTQAWWLGRDPFKTTELIEGRKPHHDH